VRRATVGFVVVVAALAASPDALALSRQQANTIAMRTLRPQEQSGRVVLFGLPQALGPKRSVSIAAPSRLGLVPRKKGLKPLRRKAWLFWLDLEFEARFEHASVMLLVDNASGRVRLRRSISYFPLVDGRRPAFLRTPAAYRDARYRVYTNLRVPASPRRAPALAPLTATELPANAFKDDCLIMIGVWDDPLFERDFTDLGRTASSLGLRAFWATSTRQPATSRPGRPEASGSSLVGNVSWLVNEEKCKDVMIYANGHGAKAPETPGITTGDGRHLYPGDLISILVRHPETTFKIKLDSCYSGRFMDPELQNERNLLVLETSSAAGEASYGHLSLRDGSREVANPGRAEFTHANLVGITKFVQSNAEVAIAQRQNVSLLAWMLARAFNLGAASDAARVDGLTHPQLYTNFRRRTIRVAA
jgi:hypothetical protein